MDPVALEPSRHTPRGGLDRGELERHVAAGASIRAIASQLGVSPTTVRHWLKRYGLQTRLAERRGASSDAGDRPSTANLECLRHGTARFHRRDGRYRCGRCDAEAVSRRRRRVKRILVQEHGGACVLCGYSRHIGALEFHHLDPATKSFSIGHAGVTRSLAKARAEAAKCALLCANCHAEVEAGIVAVPSGGVGESA